MNRKIIEKDGFTFVAPAVRKNKKYSVYHDGVYLTSFGQIRPTGEPYEQYEDKISDYYSRWNHFDDRRRMNYRRRHAKDNLNDLSSAGFWSYYYLW